MALAARGSALLTLKRGAEALAVAGQAQSLAPSMPDLRAQIAQAQVLACPAGRAAAGRRSAPRRRSSGAQRFQRRGAEPKSLRTAGAAGAAAAGAAGASRSNWRGPSFLDDLRLHRREQRHHLVLHAIRHAMLLERDVQVFGQRVELRVGGVELLVRVDMSRPVYLHGPPVSSQIWS